MDAGILDVHRLAGAAAQRAAQVTFSTSVPVFNLLLEPSSRSPADQAPVRALAVSGATSLAGAKPAPPSTPSPTTTTGRCPHHHRPRWWPFTQYSGWKRAPTWRFEAACVVARDRRGASLSSGGVVGYQLAELDLTSLRHRLRRRSQCGLIPEGLKGVSTMLGIGGARRFCLVLLGALVSTSRQDEVSRNSQGMDPRFLNEGSATARTSCSTRATLVRMGDHYVHYREKGRR